MSFLLIFLLFVDVNFACVEMRGIGNGTNDIYTLEDLCNFPVDTARGDRRDLEDEIGFTDTLAGYETPQQLRISFYIVAAWYQVYAAFEEIALEAFGRLDISESRRRCTDGIDARLIKYHLKLAELYVDLYSYRTGRDWDYLKVDHMSNLMQEWGVDPYICDNGDCDGDVSTPWGLAYEIANELYILSENDGWNQNGDYDRQYNKIPFSDFRDENRKYRPMNNAWNLEYVNRWQPLLESDELGFLYNQEHVTPHIGYTGLSIYFSNDEICSLSTNNPNYDYNVEMELLFDRLAELTEEQKVKIEVFDDKGILTSFSHAIGRAIAGSSGAELNFERVKSSYARAVSTYEAIIAVWKEKVDWDLVRPTSIVHKFLDGQQITTYAGVTANGESYGTQTFLANDFEPYIRTMPHSEYPSGSACICEAWSMAMQTIYNTDDFTSLLSGAELSRTISQYSSKKEPLSTPSQDITLSYSKFSDISRDCRESRLWGGMHFSASIEAGKDLCSIVGIRVGETINALVNGEKPQFAFDPTQTYVERDCYPNYYHSDSDSDSDSDSNSQDE